MMIIDCSCENSWQDIFEAGASFIQNIVPALFACEWDFIMEVLILLLIN